MHVAQSAHSFPLVSVIICGRAARLCVCDQSPGLCSCSFVRLCSYTHNSHLHAQYTPKHPYAHLRTCTSPMDGYAGEVPVFVPIIILFMALFVITFTTCVCCCAYRAAGKCRGRLLPPDAKPLSAAEQVMLRVGNRNGARVGDGPVQVIAASGQFDGDRTETAPPHTHAYTDMHSHTHVHTGCVYGCHEG